MSSINHTRHSTYNINYHFVWIPKYRKKIISRPIKFRIKELFFEIASACDFEILALETMPDHIHLFVSAPPRWAPADIVKMFKGISGTKLFTEYPELRDEIRKGKVWSRSYYVGTAGRVTEATIKRYIDEQTARSL
ncbi:MAG: IS200/IS605 family transposase [Syntrophorhabdales bacterium]|jgi:putative transposase